MNNVTKYILNVITLSVLSISLLGNFVIVNNYADIPKRQVVSEYVPGKNTNVKWNEKEEIYEVVNYESLYNNSESFPEIKGVNFVSIFARWFLDNDASISSNYENTYNVKFYGLRPLIKDNLDFKIKVFENGEKYKQGLKATTKVYSGNDVLSPKDIAKANDEGKLKIIIDQNFLFKGQEKYYPALKVLIATIPLLLALAYVNPYRLRIGKSIMITIITILSINLITMIVMHQLNNVAGINHLLLLNNFILINLSLTPAYIKMVFKKRIKR